MILTPKQLSERSRIYVGSCHDAIERMAPSSVSLVVTSPPYDGLRTYHGGPGWDYEQLGRQLLRVVTVGGVAAVVIQDQTSDFAKSGTSFRLAVSWMDLGWRLFECCIYRREACPGKWWSQRFRVDHEFVMIFFRGNRPKTFDKSSFAVLSKSPGKTGLGAKRQKNGSIKPMSFVVGEFKCRGTVWDYQSSSTERNAVKTEHPATFPDALADDLVRCFSKPGDLVLDPFLGSGTTAVISANRGRRFVGCEISPKYVEIVKRRLWKESPIDPKVLPIEKV